MNAKTLEGGNIEKLLGFEARNKTGINIMEP
jgi:hypothetical protein